MTYRPKFVRQWNDPTTRLDWFNCNMASGAMALDFDTLGAVQKWGGQLRAHSGDYVGGTGLNDPGLTRAWRYYGQTLHVRTGNHWHDVMASLKEYRAVVLQGWYGKLPARYQSQLNSFSFVAGHSVVLLPEFKDGNILMGDPLSDRFTWVPERYLKAFAEELGRRELGASTPQRLFYAVSDAHVPAKSPALPPTAPTVTDPVKYVHTVQITATTLNIRESASASSKDVGNLRRGARIKTTHLRRKGGSYTVGGTRRTDWLGFTHNGETDWVARAYTKVVT